MAADDFRRIARRLPQLAPRDASVAAFVAWMRSLGETGDHVQADLYDLYSEICELTRSQPEPITVFGRELERLGCRRWQGDLEKFGRRWRPMMVRI